VSCDLILARAVSIGIEAGSGIHPGFGTWNVGSKSSFPSYPKVSNIRTLRSNAGKSLSGIDVSIGGGGQNFIPSPNHLRIDEGILDIDDLL